jgi:hypothetical protein
MPRTGLRFAVVSLVAIHVVIGAGAVAAQPGTTYASLSDLPNFSGSWTPLTPPFVLAPARPEARRPAGAAPQPPGGCALPPQYKPEVAARCREALEQRRAAGDVREFCEQQVFLGRPPTGAGGAFEILFTPGRVTMAVEYGYVRRIYMRDEPPPGSLDESRGGTSVGRWEGATLVVETTGLDPNGPIVPGSVLGRGARVAERISLVDADTLRIEATITAPAVLDAPLTTSMQYRRAPDRVFTDFDTCVEGDRSVDRATGRDRFDRTPPPDLPPPPTN